MRNGTIAAMLVAFVVLGVGAGYFIGVNSSTTLNSAGSKSLETFSACTITDPSKGITIRVTDGTSPVGGASITVQDISTCSGTVPRVVAQYDIATNSTGWAGACSEYDGTCNFSIHFSGENYSLSVPLTPGILSYVYYDLSTGNVTVITQ
jgi:hypothetical protein